MTTRQEAGPEITKDRVVFRVSDPDESYEEVRLLQEIRRPRNEPLFTRRNGVWEADFASDGAARIEYQFEIAHADGGREVVCDPDNPRRAPGPFGDKSVVELPGYGAPEWTEREPVEEGRLEEFHVRSTVLREDVDGLLWSSDEVDDGAAVPLLIVHDGPETARYSRLLQCLALAVEDGELPPMRAALLQPPGDRNETYSASAAYARAFSHEILPALSDAAPVPPGRAARAAMGASLGALALLHVHRRHPAIVGGLFLQSGSFFRMRYDRQEAGFPRFRRISRFVGTVLTAEDWAHPIPVTMTCGTVEENLANNRAVADALRRQGYPVKLHEHPDAHNWISWRDVFRPHLVDLLQGIWT